MSQMLTRLRDNLVTTARPFPDVTVRALVLHERGLHGYRSIEVVATDEADGPWSPSTSSTAWRELGAHHGAVLVDVIGSEVHRLDSAGRRMGRHGGAAMSAGSVVILGGRGATHVLAVPVLDGDTLTGMLSVEMAAAPPFELPPGLVPALLAQLRPGLASTPRLAPARRTEDPHLPIVGAATRPVVEALRRFSAFEETILLRGPTGVGKTRLARWVHANSRRRAGPFVPVNLHAIPDTLLEGELFGWRKGAHDKAAADRTGYIAAAERGTLFLDEIDKLGLGGQEKLLQLLESKEWRALGDPHLRRADVRFVIATNADLESAVTAGSFREDLYYRINELPVEVPGLEARGDELPLWADWFLDEMQRGEGRPGASRLTREAAAALSARSWPGNLRELSRVLRRAWILACPEGAGDVVVDVEHLEKPRAAASALSELLRRVADAWAEEALRRAGRGEPPLTLDELRGLRGLVLEAGRARVELATFYRALGEERLVETRNHHAAYRRDVEAAAALTALLRRS